MAEEHRRLAAFGLGRVDGADGDAENLDNRAALTAKLRRQASLDDISSMTLAFTTRP